MKPAKDDSAMDLARSSVLSASLPAGRGAPAPSSRGRACRDACRLVLVLGLLLAAAAKVCAMAATLPSADAIGSRDHAELKRYEGAVILSYSQQGFAEFALPLAG